MRICWRRGGIASVLFLTASVELFAVEIEVDVFASMAGRCSTLKIAERDFACTSVAFSHSPGGRSGFTVPLNDPDDDTHIITFSGENGRRTDNDVYELPIDRMLLKSKDSPKEDGLPTPAVEPSSGTCKQVGNFVTQHVSSVSCMASDGKGRKYQLQFESDGSPIVVKMIRVADPDERQRSNELASHIEQLKCRHKAEAQGVLPRDRTEFILRCMEEEEE
jgi:hypothetical protein